LGQLSYSLSFTYIKLYCIVEYAQYVRIPNKLQIIACIFRINTIITCLYLAVIFDTMIRQGAIQAINGFMHMLCNVGCFIPYTWNSELLQVSTMPKKKLRIYNMHKWIHYIHSGWILARLLQSLQWEDVPHRIIIIHSIWAMALCLSDIAFIQYDQKRQEIQDFSNQLFNFIKKHSGNTHLCKFLFS